MFSLFQISLYSMRDILYQNGKYWSSYNFVSDKRAPKYTLNNYSTLYYMPELTDFSENRNTLSIIINELTHDPAYLQYPDYTFEAEITNTGKDFFDDIRSHKLYHTFASSLLLLTKWFDYLRENDAWDNTRIIIVADHGDSKTKNPDFSEFQETHILPYAPILLFKDFGESENLKTDEQFMTTADVPFLAMKEIISDPVNPFTGKILKTEKKDSINIFLGGTTNVADYQGISCIDDDSPFYHVVHPMMDSNNWQEVKYRDIK